MPRTSPFLLTTLFTLTLLLPIHAADLYSTDFEAFPVGNNQWAGTEGWISSDPTSGAQGIIQDPVENLPLGKTAYLGFEQPAATLTRVYRTINYNPIPSGVPRIEFESFLGIQDSTNNQRDQFFISFYDIAGNFLAAINFDNTSSNTLLWRGLSDGSVQTVETGVPFIRGDQTLGFVALQILACQIDLATNLWSAQLDGIPLFTEVPFTDSDFAPLTLGSIAAEWELTSPFTALAGDNWMLVADWFIHSAPQGSTPFLVDSVSRSPVGQTSLSWLGEPGFDYKISYSNDLHIWFENLPNSTFPDITTTAPLTFLDPDTTPQRRHYRVERTPSP